MSITKTLRHNYNAKIRELEKTLGKINAYVSNITPEMSAYQIYKDLSKMISENNEKVGKME